MITRSKFSRSSKNLQANALQQKGKNGKSQIPVRTNVGALNQQPSNVENTLSDSAISESKAMQPIEFTVSTSAILNETLDGTKKRENKLRATSIKNNLTVETTKDRNNDRVSGRKRVKNLAHTERKTNVTKEKKKKFELVVEGVGETGSTEKSKFDCDSSLEVNSGDSVHLDSLIIGSKKQRKPRKMHPRSPRVNTMSVNTPDRHDCNFLGQVEKALCDPSRVLGKGEFGTIIQATYKGKLVAVKVIPSESLGCLENELNAFFVEHDNVVKTVRVCAHERHGLIVMEMFRSSTLEVLINDVSYRLSDDVIARLLLEVLAGLSHCHENHIIHLSINPQNILVSLIDRTCKIGDFGHSRILGGDETVKMSSGQETAVYTAPELLSGCKPTAACDIYSIGLVLWHLLSRQRPYQSDGIDMKSAIRKPQTRLYVARLDNLAHLLGLTICALTDWPPFPCMYCGIIYLHKSNACPEASLKAPYLSYIIGSGNNIIKEKHRPFIIQDRSNGKLQSLYEHCWDPSPTLRPRLSQISVVLKSLVFE